MGIDQQITKMSTYLVIHDQSTVPMPDPDNEIPDATIRYVVNFSGITHKEDVNIKLTPVPVEFKIPY